MNDVLKKMTPRERWLAAAVAGTLFLIVNLFALKLFMTKQAALRSDLASKNLQMTALETLSAQRNLWTKRDAWLQARQPALASREMAGVELLDQVRTLAKKSEVTILNPSIGAFERTPSYQGAPITTETKSSWASLIRFLGALQTPENFVAIENADLKIDPEDNTAMHGTFTLAKWYAPPSSD
jgi:hypothetical protein